MNSIKLNEYIKKIKDAVYDVGIELIDYYIEKVR